ncbi:RNA polymerase factor sigma-32 [Myxococcota bacterium]|nr:RNA polymerase factor sigma-32 [Myxococcota bacterium]
MMSTQEPEDYGEEREGDTGDAPVRSFLPARMPGTAPARWDPLRAYMADVQRYPLLTPEEEKDLAVLHKETGDPAAAYRLITSNLRLVAKIAFKYQRFYQNVLDLIQEGNIGLMQAVKKYDPYRGVRLSSYARYWIQAYIMYFLLANHRMVKVGTTQAQRKLFYNLAKESKRLRDLGFDPTPKLLAERLNVGEDEVMRMTERLGRSETSFDQPIGGEDESRTVGQTLAARAPSPEDVVGEAEMRDRIDAALKSFGAALTDEREIALWNERVMSESPLTLAQVGERFGFSRERARQLEERMRHRLRDFLRDRLGDEVVMSLEILP